MRSVMIWGAAIAEGTGQPTVLVYCRIPHRPDALGKAIGDQSPSGVPVLLSDFPVTTTKQDLEAALHSLPASP